MKDYRVMMILQCPASRMFIYISRQRKQTFGICNSVRSAVETKHFLNDAVPSLLAEYTNRSALLQTVAI